MSTPRGDVDAAVAGLRARWGAAAPRASSARWPWRPLRRSPTEIRPRTTPARRPRHPDRVRGARRDPRPRRPPEVGQRRDPRRRLERPHHARACGSPPRPRRRARSSPGSTCRAASTRSRRSPAASASSGSSSSRRPASTRVCRSPGACSPAGRSTCSSSTCPAGAWHGPTRRRGSPIGSIGSPRSPVAPRRCC